MRFPVSVTESSTGNLITYAWCQRVGVFDRQRREEAWSIQQRLAVARVGRQPCSTSRQWRLSSSILVFFSNGG